MRQWLKDVYMKLPMLPQIKRTRTPVPIQIKNVSVVYSGENHFSIRIYDPSHEENFVLCRRPALIMYHGGGWMHGSPEGDEGAFQCNTLGRDKLMMTDLSKFFASELRSVVIGVDYRLAPENLFPLPHNDCFEVLNWISNNATEYMIDTNRVGLWGASAGGNLAASVALRDSAENDTARVRHVNLVVPATCHPKLYPAVLQVSSASLKQFPFHGASTAEESASCLGRLWGKSKLGYETFPTLTK